MQYWHETVICNLKHESVPTIVHQRYRLHTTQVLSSHYCTGNNTTQHNTTHSVTFIFTYEGRKSIGFITDRVQAIT